MFGNKMEKACIATLIAKKKKKLIFKLRNYTFCFIIFVWRFKAKQDVSMLIAKNYVILHTRTRQTIMDYIYLTVDCIR